MDNLINDFEKELKNLEDISEMVSWHSGGDTLNEVGEELEKKIILHEAKLRMLLVSLRNKKSPCKCNCDNKSPHIALKDLETEEFLDRTYIREQEKLYCVVYTGKLTGGKKYDNDKLRIILYPTMAENDSIARVGVSSYNDVRRDFLNLFADAAISLSPRLFLPVHHPFYPLKLYRRISLP